MQRLSAITISFAAFLACGCPTTPPEEDAGDGGGVEMDGDRPDAGDMSPSGTTCAPGPSDEFILGTVEMMEPRVFRPFDPAECGWIEVQSGIQGGWHLEPALQAPSDAAIPDLGGEMTWRVFDADGELISKEARFEMFRAFWQDLGGGYTYWGDFVIFLDYPEDYLDGQVTIEVELDFDESSALEDQTLRQTVLLRDEVAEWMPP